MFDIVLVDFRRSDAPEQLGTKTKFWFKDEQGRRMLFKAEERGTGEDWAEKIACEICRRLGCRMFITNWLTTGNATSRVSFARTLLLVRESLYWETSCCWRAILPIPPLFVYNELLVISDGDSTRVGSLTAGSDRFSPWRLIDDYRNPGRPLLEGLIKGLFKPSCLLDYLRHCVTFEEDQRSGDIIKKVAAYHQFRAVRNARTSVKAALKPPAGEGDGRGGVIWHTQGSGKSLTMLMLAGSVIGDEQLANPTVVMVTDRNDLDGQLFGTFAAGRALLRQAPEQAESRDDLAAKLNRASGGVVFTTIQKFEERGQAVSQRSNIVVMADEAHRSQYGFLDGGARWMRDAIPNATFVGFTGTPIESDDVNTPAVFGDYCDIYDIRQAI